eukprot:GFUD01066284.1.p1 GENE.GFUD01066284.1~~GFUD01066284.1.p1  ORF type:complete len:509 (-),score=75.50 GFUD01066284.1:55-1581(-)
MGDWTIKNSYYLTLMTAAYIIGEICHFLINTTGREVARDIHFGDKSCFFNDSYADPSEDKSSNNCSMVKDQKECTEVEYCSWEYSGLGIEYQILAGPAFVAVFSVSGVAISILSDKLKATVSRVLLVGIGTATFSSACLLMGFADSYWQLVLLRMLIAAGESVCRPMCGAMLADLFSPKSRGVANGVFSWGVYVGFGMAFVLGINGTSADIAGYGWRAPYIITAIPGLVVAVLFICTLKDPKPDSTPAAQRSTSPNPENKTYFQRLIKSFANPALLILLIAAMARHTAGLTWAYNTRLYFQSYHPHFDLGYWILLASVLGGSFGVFAGGFFSDRLVGKLGLHSRLWLLAACTLIAAPFAAGTLYYDPPGAMGFLIAYYFFAETWFAVLFTVIVEIVDPEVRATCIALFLFCMNQVGGNLPVIITPLKSQLDDYRSALAIVWPGFLVLSSFLFFLSSFPLCYIERERQRRAAIDEQRTVSQARTPSPTSQDSADIPFAATSPTVPLLVK